MGYSYQFRCKDCKYEQHLYEGWNFMIHDQSVNEYLQSTSLKLHYRTHQKIIQLNKNYKNLHLKMEYRICRCKNCLQVSDRLFVQVIHEDRVLHQTRFKCSACHTTLIHTNIHSLKHATCPKCKGNRFSKNKELVLWN